MSQKWFRSKCISLVLLALPLTANAAKLPKLLSEVEAKYSKSATLSANFSQINESAALGQKKTTSGRIFVKRPSKVRWETQHPDSSLLVGNGVRFWFYTPPFEEGERGQVIEKKSSDVQSKLVHALLAGSFSIARDMKIRQTSPSSFLLVPRKGTAGTVREATLTVDPNLKIIQKVVLTHEGGNHAEITLSHIQLGQPLAEDLFVFKTPPNTDHIRGATK